MNKNIKSILIIIFLLLVLINIFFKVTKLRPFINQVKTVILDEEKKEHRYE